jgi:hypothetical protein
LRSRFCCTREIKISWSIDLSLSVSLDPQQNVVTEAKRAQREEAFIAPAEKAGQTIEERKKAKKSKKREE